MEGNRVVAAIVGCGLFIVAATGAIAGSDGAGQTADPARVQLLQERILGDPAIMSIILSLQNDPDLQALLSDPAVVAAIRAGDLSSLAKDPRVVKLLSKPQLKEVEKRLQ
jgi:hypothetical protein